MAMNINPTDPVTMQRARPFNNAEVRDIYRTTTACELSTMDQSA